MFDTPDLAAMDDAIANGTLERPPGAPEPLALFRAARVDYSLHRLYHYTGTDPEHFQNFVIFTNYQFYVDEFAQLGHSAWPAGEAGPEAFVEPGNVITRNARLGGGTTGDGARAHAADAGLSSRRAAAIAASRMINIGVGPSNARNITDHVAVLRPHAWLMLGHCAGLRNTQQLGDYVLAHGYVREDHVLDDELPLWVPIPALAEMQVALEQAVGEVTGLEGFELKRIMRTGTVASVDNRNWEICGPAVIRARCRRSRAIALDMESATIAANGFSLPRSLRHAALRLRQAAARRDQARRHGQRLLPPARRPASRDRPSGAGAAQAAGIGAPAFAQAAQLCRGRVSVDDATANGRAMPGHDAAFNEERREAPQLFFTSEQTLFSSGRKASSAGIVATSL